MTMNNLGCFEFIIKVGQMKLSASGNKGLLALSNSLLLFTCSFSLMVIRISPFFF